MNSENEQDILCLSILSMVEPRLEQALARWEKELPLEGVDQMGLMVSAIAKALVDSKSILRAAQSMSVSEDVSELQMEMVEILKRPGAAVVEKWSAATSGTPTVASTVLFVTWQKKNPLALTRIKLSAWKARVNQCQMIRTQKATREAKPSSLNGKKLTFFVASSTEAINTARKLINALSNNPDSAKWKLYFWNDPGVFVAGKTTIESLEKTFRKCDFGIYLLTADDKLVIRHKHTVAPRGNVVFELGMGVGFHSHRRSFIVHEDVDIISDLDGISTVKYKKLKAAKTPSAEEIVKVVKALVHAVNDEVNESGKN